MLPRTDPGGSARVAAQNQIAQLRFLPERATARVAVRVGPMV
jgi:hypothetical protein